MGTTAGPHTGSGPVSIENATAKVMWRAFSAKHRSRQSMASGKRAHIGMAAVLLLAFSPAAIGASITFSMDPFEGSNVRSVSRGQVVAGEVFIAFSAAL